MGCCEGFAKAILIITNIITMLAGLGILGISIWIVVDASSLLQYFENVDSQDQAFIIQSVGISGIVAGALLFILSIFGCCGAMKQHKCLLAIFGVLTVILAAGILTLAIIALANENWIKTIVEEEMRYEADHDITTGLLNLAHGDYGCCGIHDETTCSQDYPPTDVCKKDSILCKNGCLDAFWTSSFEPMILTGGIVMIGVAIAIAFEAFLAFCVCCKHTDN